MLLYLNGVEFANDVQHRGVSVIVTGISPRIALYGGDVQSFDRGQLVVHIEFTHRDGKRRRCVSKTSAHK